MNIPCRELKRISRENLTFHYTIPMGVFFTGIMIPLLMELPFASLQDQYATRLQTGIFFVAEFLISIFSAVLTFGEYYMHLNMARKKTYTFSDLFYPVKNRSEVFLPAACLLAVVGLIGNAPALAGIYLLSEHRSLTAILPAVSGIVLSLILSYVIRVEFLLLYFVLLDHRDMGLLAAIKLARELLRGNRGRLWYVYLSFLGMQILSVLSLTVGFLWVSPYCKQTLANFYLSVSGTMPAPQTVGQTFNQAV